ncbi:MAG: hypothetical protein ACKVQQ_11800 [Burkholderiales bacterium]
MDVLAHALWAGAGMAALGRRRQIVPRTIAATLVLATLPDVLHMLPILGWWIFGEGSGAELWAMAVASPGNEPALPLWVERWSHHLHCVAHSAVVAAAVTAVLWVQRRWLWIPLLGWWSHIVIDVFTHSAAYYPSPVLYPLTRRGFDGLAWNTPWFLAVNYFVLAAVCLALWISRPRNRGRPGTGPTQTFT